VLVGRFERVGFVAGCEVFERSLGVLILVSRRLSSFSDVDFSSLLGWKENKWVANVVEVNEVFALERSSIGRS
jgi:hypothetical protein